ncbi:phage tail protein [Streptomyces sp. NBC_00536]|uniref:phage tail protein n=1 Tax=Streptomyces sp. NBC_00536 TaxID=2975769 RepID=UPI002E80D06D|nr:phage tail protein [Streptomyces sp. NBC_00536]WUC82739.1 phage tail protein [Streptomyces sp. NBC_00536]
MYADRTLSLLADPDQWARCAHEATALLDEGGVCLAWEPEPEEGPRPAGHGPAGLAFDRWGRGYRSHPRTGRVELLPADGAGAGALAAGAPQHPPGALCVPRGLAVDTAQRLYIAESGAGAVQVVDLWAERPLRRVPVRDTARPHRRPLDLTAHCGAVVALLTRPAGLVVLRGRRDPRPGPALRPPAGAEGLRPTRIADHAGQLYVLWTGADGGRAVLARADGSRPLAVPGAGDLDFTADGTLVAARGPGQPFRLFRPDGHSWAETEPLRAPGYDGGAVTVAPDGRITFTTASGTGRSAGPAARYTPTGTVICYRLDGAAYRTRWGRVFLDACVPPGTDVRISCLTSDEDTVPDPLPAAPPVRGGRTVRHPELTPPLPSRDQLASSLPDPAPLFRRPTGREWPWAQIAPDDGYDTYEAPVPAPPGRYLWIVLRLTGTRRLTPRVRGLRVERPGHRLPGQLPRAWSRDEGDTAFLQRFLAPAEGLLHELDGRAAERALLLDPDTTPQEALGWLAGLLGLALDRRWPVAARRALLAQAHDLFRIRGTVACLERILRLYLPLPLSVVESWRLRGLGGAVLGAGPGGPPAPAVGGAASTSGALGRFTVGGTRPGEDGYTATAHRFSVLIPADLGAEQLEVVRAVADAHKPAHTLVDICLLGAGMRVGRTLHLGLTSVVGPGAAWDPAVLGAVRLGDTGVVGVPATGSRVGETSITGAVRVG